MFLAFATDGHCSHHLLALVHNASISEHETTDLQNIANPQFCGPKTYPLRAHGLLHAISAHHPADGRLWVASIAARLGRT